MYIEIFIYISSIIFQYFTYCLISEIFTNRTDKIYFFLVNEVQIKPIQFKGPG